MNENIHIKISADDKEELAQRAKQLGLSLSGYIRQRLKMKENLYEALFNFIHESKH